MPIPIYGYFSELIVFAPFNQINRLAVFAVIAQEYPTEILLLQLSHADQVSSLVEYGYRVLESVEMFPDVIIRVFRRCNLLRAIIIENSLRVHHHIIDSVACVSPNNHPIVLVIVIVLSRSNENSH